MNNEIKKLLNSKVFFEIKNRKLIIEEKSNISKDNTLKKLIVTDVPRNSIAFTLDSTFLSQKSRGIIFKENHSTVGADGSHQLSWILDHNHKQANKKCDFILISPKFDNFIVVIGEIKTTSPEDNAHSQLINSKIFMEYILNLLNRYHNVNKMPTFKLVTLVKFKNNFMLTHKGVLPSIKLKEDEDPYIKTVHESTSKISFGDMISSKKL